MARPPGLGFVQGGLLLRRKSLRFWWQAMGRLFFLAVAAVGLLLVIGGFVGERCRQRIGKFVGPGWPRRGQPQCDH